MIKKINKKAAVVSAVIFGILIALVIGIAFGLDALEKIFSIIGSLSLGVALFTYFYTKKQDETLAAIEQIAFFREKIIYEWNGLQTMITEKYPQYWFSRMKLDKRNIEDLKKGFSKNFENQASLFLDISNEDSTKWKLSSPILVKQVLLLNMLEEFSLRVNHFKTQEHPALDSVHATFVDLVEKNALALVYMRDIFMNNPIYSATLSLYDAWEKRVQKSNILNNLEKHGFITKAKLEEILKKQREQVKKAKT